MKQFLVAFICCLCASGAMRGMASQRASADYRVTAEVIGVSGARLQSAAYSAKVTAAGETGTGHAALSSSSNYSNRAGFAGALFDLVALSVSAPPSTSLNEAASRQLSAAPLADDGTTFAPLDPASVMWSILSGPIASISSSGLVTAANVYQDTAASLSGSAQGLNGQLELTILNVGKDDYGSYAGDQIDDDWQVLYFGENNPNAGPNVDVSGTGQNNLFKFVAGLNPLDGSRFALEIQPVTGQPTSKKLIFQPIVTGRTYTVQFSPNLPVPDWQPLSGATQSDNGAQRTVTDPNASDLLKFYRVQISKP